MELVNGQYEIGGVSVLELCKEYFATTTHTKPLVPGVDYIPASGKTLDENDLVNLVDSSLDMWLTTGRYADIFESEFAKFME